MKTISFVLGLPIGFYLVMHPVNRDLDPAAAWVLPVGWVFTVEYTARFLEWAKDRSKRLLF